MLSICYAHEEWRFLEIGGMTEQGVFVSFPFEGSRTGPAASVPSLEPIIAKTPKREQEVKFVNTMSVDDEKTKNHWILPLLNIDDDSVTITDMLPPVILKKNFLILPT